MRATIAAVVVALALALAWPAAAKVSPMYMDDPGGGGTWGAFYVCTPERCGWWFCWPGGPCYPI